jgi:drug/metabolite transporter (DMT)-like permease
MIYFLLFIQQLISSSTHLVADDISEKLHPIHIVLIRGIFTCLAFAVWFAIRKGTWKRVSRADVPLILGLGLLNISINQILFIWGVKFTTAPNASLAYALTPVFVVFIARMVYKQSVSMLKWIGVVTAIAGAVIVLNERGLAVQADQSVGNIMVLSASISWAVYTFYSSRLIERYGAVQAIALTFFSGLLLYVPVWLAMPVQAPLVDVLSAAGSSSTWLWSVVCSAQQASIEQCCRVQQPTAGAHVGSGAAPVWARALGCVCHWWIVGPSWCRSNSAVMRRYTSPMLP